MSVKRKKRAVTKQKSGQNSSSVNGKIVDKTKTRIPNKEYGFIFKLLPQVLPDTIC